MGTGCVADKNIQKLILKWMYNSMTILKATELYTLGELYSTELSILYVSTYIINLYIVVVFNFWGIGLFDLSCQIYGCKLFIVFPYYPLMLAESVVISPISLVMLII